MQFWLSLDPRNCNQAHVIPLGLAFTEELSPFDQAFNHLTSVAAEQFRESQPQLTILEKLIFFPAGLAESVRCDQQDVSRNQLYVFHIEANWTISSKDPQRKSRQGDVIQPLL